LNNQRAEFLRLIALLITRASVDDVILECSAFHRSAETQHLLYEVGRTVPGEIITNCDGFVKISPHQKWRAMDLFILNEDGTANWDSPYYDRLGEIWENMGGTWGGHFSTLCDKAHFEL
jgi:peptidoglycan L-alanyl-D-glutamate endopeptidase CwlK